jgi:hypothetical protein
MKEVGKSIGAGSGWVTLTLLAWSSKFELLMTGVKHTKHVVQI